MAGSNTFNFQVSYDNSLPLNAVIEKMAVAAKVLEALGLKLDEIQITPVGIGEGFACLIRDSGKLDGVSVRLL